MPSQDVHCAISKKRTGYPFRSLHKWIDKHHKKYGVNHRTKRHAFNKKEEKEIKDFWDKKGMGLGRKAVVEWLFHIALDNLETSFKEAKRAYRKEHIHNFFKFGFLHDSRYVHAYSCPLSEEEIKREIRMGRK